MVKKQKIYNGFMLGASFGLVVGIILSFDFIAALILGIVAPTTITTFDIIHAGINSMGLSFIGGIIGAVFAYLLG